MIFCYIIFGKMFFLDRIAIIGTYISTFVLKFYVASILGLWKYVQSENFLMLMRVKNKGTVFGK